MTDDELRGLRDRIDDALLGGLAPSSVNAPSAVPIGGAMLWGIPLRESRYLPLGEVRAELVFSRPLWRRLLGGRMSDVHAVEEPQAFALEVDGRMTIVAAPGKLVVE